MAIPSGYRLLTAEDVGKVFGVDLEQVIYFDTSANISNINTSATWIGGVIKSPQREQLTMVFDNVLVWDKRYASVPSPYWIYDTYTIPSGTEITSYFTSGSSWNNTFLYVKEKVAEPADPYSITIKNKEGIKLLTKDKLLTNDVKVTIDESLLGGGESESPYTLNLTLGGSNYSVVSYSIDGTNYVNCTNGTSIYTIKNYGVVFIKKDANMSNATVGAGLVVKYGAAIKSSQESVLVQTIKETTLSLTTQASGGGAGD